MDSAQAYGDKYRPEKHRHGWVGCQSEEDLGCVHRSVSDEAATEGIESFAELVFRISAKDLREYFELYDEAKYARFNSIGLCVGNIGHDLDTGDTELCNVIQFSVLNISNEMLHFDKDLTIIYRVFIS